MGEKHGFPSLPAVTHFEESLQIIRFLSPLHEVAVFEDKLSTFSVHYKLPLDDLYTM